LHLRTEFRSSPLKEGRFVRREVRGYSDPLSGIHLANLSLGHVLDSVKFLVGHRYNLLRESCDL
jgi:hypothetical protein